jgi:hypothetical protein
MGSCATTGIVRNPELLQLRVEIVDRNDSNRELRRITALEYSFQHTTTKSLNNFVSQHTTQNAYKRLSCQQLESSPVFENGCILICTKGSTLGQDTL